MQMMPPSGCGRGWAGCGGTANRRVPCQAVWAVGLDGTGQPPGTAQSSSRLCHSSLCEPCGQVVRLVAQWLRVALGSWAGWAEAGAGPMSVCGSLLLCLDLLWPATIALSLTLHGSK